MFTTRIAGKDGAKVSIQDYAARHGMLRPGRDPETGRLPGQPGGASSPEGGAPNALEEWAFRRNLAREGERRWQGRGWLGAEMRT